MARQEKQKIQKKAEKDECLTCLKMHASCSSIRFVLIRPLHVHLSNSLQILPHYFYTSTRGKGKSSHCGLFSHISEA